MIEEEKGYELPAWLLTYGDMVTLLVTFFVMLISLSTINMDKCKENLEKMKNGFAPDNVSLLDDNTLFTEEIVKNETEIVEDTESFETKEQIVNQENPEEVYNYLMNFIDENELSQFIDIEEIKIGYKLKIPAHLCFEKGESVLKSDAYQSFDKLGALLHVVKGTIVVDANTEIAKAKNDLPVTRAAEICEYFMTKEEIEPCRIAIAGNRMTVSDNDTIEITLLKK